MLSLRNVTLAYGGPALLDSISLEIGASDRIALVGRNGAGKTTLLRLINGEIRPDSGEIKRLAGTRVAALPQSLPPGLDGTVREILTDAPQSDTLPEWEIPPRVDRALQEMDLDGDALFSNLSVGMCRRVLLARCIVTEPTLLILDEPTNHLDIPAIEWLEDFLKRRAGALLFVTHDRAFLADLANRIIDLDRGQLTSWECDYPTFLRRRTEQLAAEAKQDAVFDRKLAREEIWIRKGIQARRTRNEGRVRALKAMREERRARRASAGSAGIDLETAGRSGDKVIVAENLFFAYDNTPVIRDFSCLIMRGDRIGIVGPNGCGKSTLLRLLLGDLSPQHGYVRQGTRLVTAYFDQLRERLNDDDTVHDSVADGNQFVEINGVRRHVITYLQEFLFSPDRIRGTVRHLSGGERNRLLLARLFTRPCNLLILDEPTNDLDQETLELLEEQLAEFTGTLIVVSHDRVFLNNVVTGIFAFEGDGDVRYFVGGYDDYTAVRERDRSKGRPPIGQPGPAAPAQSKGRPSKPRRFLNRERWELERIPDEIAELEAEQARLTETLADPTTYQDGVGSIEAAQARLSEIEALLHQKLARWEELERLRGELEE